MMQPEVKSYSKTWEFVAHDGHVDQNIQTEVWSDGRRQFYKVHNMLPNPQSQSMYNNYRSQPPPRLLPMPYRRLPPPQQQSPYNPDVFRNRNLVPLAQNTFDRQGW
jgi:hypothetical protein